jgi:hypothetical protein
MSWCHGTVGTKRFSQLLMVYVERQAILTPQLITSHVLSGEFLIALLHLSSDIPGEMKVSNQNQWLDPQAEGGTLAVNYCLVVLSSSILNR